MFLNHWVILGEATRCEVRLLLFLLLAGISGVAKQGVDWLSERLPSLITLCWAALLPNMIVPLMSGVAVDLSMVHVSSLARF